jgi:hypothetical protein
MAVSLNAMPSFGGSEGEKTRRKRHDEDKETLA